MPLRLDVLNNQHSLALAYIKRLQLSFKTHRDIRDFHLYSPLFPSSLLPQKFFFWFVVVVVFSQVLVRRSRVLWCIARLVVVVSWEAFAHEIQHPWEGDKKLQGDRPTGLDFFIFSVFGFSGSKV